MYGENGRDIRSMLSEWKVSWVVRIHVVVKPGFYLFVDVGELGTSLDEGNLRVPIHQSLAFLSRSSSGLMHRYIIDLGFRSSSLLGVEGSSFGGVRTFIYEQFD